MALEITPTITGNEVIDIVKGVQVIADGITNPDRKIDYAMRTLRITRAAQLLGESLMIGASRTFLRQPDEPRGTLTHIPQSLLFTGRLVQFTYMYDPDVPVDTITLGFDAPEVFDVRDRRRSTDSAPLTGDFVVYDMKDTDSFRRSMFQVPILAVESCMQFAA